MTIQREPSVVAPAPIRPAPGPVEARIGAAVGSAYEWLQRNRFTRGPWAVMQTFSRAEGTLLSGSMAFYTFLSLLPLLLVGGFVIGTLSRVSVDIRQQVVGAVGSVFPDAQAADLVSQLVSGRAALGLFGLVALLYSSSGFVGALTACLNRMWGVETGRNPVSQKLLNLGVVVVMGTTLMSSAALTIWARFLADSVLGAGAGWVVAVMDRLASPISLLILILLLYQVLPARAQAWRSQLPGAVFATLGIEALRGAFSFWARHSSGVATLPRSVLSVVLVLVWLGLVSQFILYGAAVNVVRSRGDDPGEDVIGDGEINDKGD